MGKASEGKKRALIDPSASRRAGCALAHVWPRACARETLHHPPHRLFLCLVCSLSSIFPCAVRFIPRLPCIVQHMHRVSTESQRMNIACLMLDASAPAL